MNLKYYLDTNAVQSLGSKLESISSENFFTSIWAQIELVSAIEDEDSFRRKKAALKHLQESGIFVDQEFFGVKLYKAFGAIQRTNYSFDDFSNRILPLVLQAYDYNDLMIQFDKIKIKKVFNKLKEMDGLSSSASDYLEKNTWPIFDYDNKWSGDKNCLLNESIDYFAGRLHERTGFSKEQLLSQYDHSIDYFLLIDYYYVEQKKHSHDAPGRNDMNDLYHLLYLKEGDKLVTDDKGFQKYVNKMVDGLAVGTEQFLEEIVSSKIES